MTAGRPHHRLALVVIAAAQLMVMLDLTIVNIALPAIQRELHFSATNLTWVIDAYVLAFGGLLLLGGRSGDLFGRRRMLVVGIAVFAGASLAGGLATDQAWLIAARALQGVGAAVASPTALALVATTFTEGAERNRAMAVYAGMSAAGGALGLLLGGILVDVASWRWVLFVNVPIGAAVLALAPLALGGGPTRPPGRANLDVPGALSASAGTALLVYGLVRAPGSGWSSAGTLAAFAAAAAVLAGFVALERTSRAPLVPLGFLRDRNRTTGYLMMLLLGAAMLSLIFFLTQFLQEVLHYSPVLAGVAYLPVPISVAVTSVVVSRLLRRVRIRLFLTLGPVLVSAGLIGASFVTATSGYGAVFGPLALVGVGMGLSFMPLTLNAVAGVGGHESGLASALLNTSQQLGGSLGLAALVTLAATATRAQLGHLSAAAHQPVAAARLHALAVAASVHGEQVALRGAAVAALAAVALAVSLHLPRGAATRRDGAGALRPVPPSDAVPVASQTPSPDLGRAAPRAVRPRRRARPHRTGVRPVGQRDGA